VQGPVLAIIYASCLSVVLAFMGVRCQLFPSSILATNKRTLGISRSQKWSPRDRSMQSFMGNTGSLNSDLIFLMENKSVGRDIDTIK